MSIPQVPKVVSVKALEKYKIQVAFADGISGILDLQHLSGKEIFSIWEVDDNFKKVAIKENGVIGWSGDLDIDVINAYCEIKGITLDQLFQLHGNYA
ncbi:MAG: DUF2442 domain-containing protein [Flavisolibacter sp.]|nr:DUF2442 domain-containing protein [Flavisolibacter sp.]